MTTDVQPAAQFVNPISGEVLTLAAHDEDLGRYLSDVREYESMIREAKRTVNRELLSRLDRRAKWTVHLPGGLKLSAPSPKPEESWDGAELRAELLSFVDAGTLSIEAVDSAVEQVVSFKPRKTGINALRALGGDIAAVIDRLVTKAEKDRYVSVGRS